MLKLDFVFDNNKNMKMGSSDDIFSDSFTSNPSQSDIFASTADVPLVAPVRRKTRRSVATDSSEIEFEKQPRKRRAKGPKVNYVKSMKKDKSRLSTSMRTPFEWTWSKFGWMVCAALCLRLVLMDQGVLDFYAMENTLTERTHSLELLRIENAEIITEIHKIKTSPRYQRKIAREHLGVIAKDEYLVLFANDGIGNSFR